MRCICHVVNLVVNELLQTPLVGSLQETTVERTHRRLSGERKPKKVVRYVTSMMLACIHPSNFHCRANNRGNLNAFGKIRYIALSIRSSPQKYQAFKNICKRSNEKHSTIPLNNETRWSSGYNMLHRAIE